VYPPWPEHQGGYSRADAYSRAVLAKMKIAFIGGGNMANAIIGGLLQKGVAAGQISVVEIDADARARLSERLHVVTTPDVAQAVQDAAVVVLAVKPQQLREVASQLQPQLVKQLVVSIAAGIRSADLARWLGGYARIVRAMPNTPALVLAGISALYAMPGADEQDRQTATSILQSVGTTLWIDREELMDAVTAVSGSGPAYVFYVMEAMMQAGEELGLSATAARQLTLETFAGAALLARQSDEPVSALRKRVTSKGGTTERAIHSLDVKQIKAHFVEAVRQAALRSRELGDELGKAD
jgi:pyrroline-5-carboxylate reductase